MLRFTGVNISALALMYTLAPFVTYAEIFDPFACIPIANDLACKASTVETEKIYFSNADFDWGCTDGKLHLEFNNTTTESVVQITIVGTETKARLTETVSVEPGKYKELNFGRSLAFCGKEKSASVYTERKTRKCSEYYSQQEYVKLQARCAQEEREKAAIAEKEAEADFIYNNCIIDKSQNVDNAVLRSVRDVCREIADSPSLWQRLRWGKQLIETQ